MKQQLVLQLPCPPFDYDYMVSLETLLIENLPDESIVDGHDIGREQANIFIHTEEPTATFNAIRELLRDETLWQSARVACRPLDGTQYEILWPVTLKEFRIS